MRMRKCTDPNRWRVVPGSDATEVEVEAYLSHTRECVFHAQIEERHQKMIETIAAVARNKSMDGHPILPMEAMARIRENFNRLGERESRNTISTILQRMKLEWDLRPGLPLFIVIVIVLLLTTQFLITKRPKQIAQRAERQQQIEKQAPAPGSSIEQLRPDQQDLNRKEPKLASQRHTRSLQSGDPPNPSTSERKPKNLTPNKDAVVGSPASHVQRIYLSIGLDPELRRALNNSFQARGIAMAESDDDAAVVLRAEQTRGEEVMVELLNKSHQRLWWINANASNESATKVDELAEKIVNDLLSKIESLKRTESRP